MRYQRGEARVIDEIFRSTGAKEIIHGHPRICPRIRRFNPKIYRLV